MKQVLVLAAIIGFCLIAGSAGQEAGQVAEQAAEQAPAENSFQNEADFEANARFFFGTGDPCSNSFYQFLGITDVKCSVQCYLQAGFQQGGYCDNGVCQCNEVTTGGYF